MASTMNGTKRVLADADGNHAAKEPAKKAKAVKKTKQITKKEVNEKIKYASKPEITALLKTIFADFPQTCQVLEFHTPDNAPTVPLPDDPLLKECFHCRTKENLVAFGEVKLCSDCNKTTFSRERIMEYFDFSKSEADKIKRTMGYGAYGGYVYQPADIIKAVKKRDGSLFDFVARKNSSRSTPSTGEALKAASTKAKKKKVIADALKYSDQSSLDYLLQRAIDVMPELKNKEGLIDSFVPSKLPKKPTGANDPILQKCFICSGTADGGATLLDFHDVKVCTGCDLSKGPHGGTLTRDKVMSYFHFSKTEADKIKRKTTTGGFYKSLIYVYNVKTVVTAAKKKHGSLYNTVSKNSRY